MEELKKIWKRQKKFNKIVNGTPKTIEEKQDLTKEFILHLISEATEVLNEINWKTHREKVYNDNNPIKKSNLFEECIDVFKYLLSIVQFWDMTPEQFVEEFNKKSDVVEQKYKQEKQLNLLKDKKIIAVDLDGVLVDYPNCLFKFVKKEKNITILQKHKDKNVNETILHYLSEKELKEIKRKYRLCGIKKRLKSMKGAKEFTKRFSKNGYKIIILSSRPYKEYPIIFSDTLKWLKKNNIKYDAVLFDEKKEEKIINKFPYMKFMVEDDGEIALKIAKKGYKVFLIDNVYNKNFSHKLIKRIKFLKDVK